MPVELHLSGGGFRRVFSWDMGSQCGGAAAVQAVSVR